MCKCLYHYNEILLCQQQNMNFFWTQKAMNLLEYFSLFLTICFGTRADESLTKLYLKGVFSTNFKITE